jgi:DNA-binding transcriptional MocR family regulator
MVIMPSCLGLPMGRLMPQQDQQQLAKLLALHPVWLLENDLDSEHCFTMPPGSRLRDWVDPHRLLVLGSLEAAVGVEAPYAYVLGRHTALAEAFALRGFQLAPLRLQALAQLFSKGEIDEQLGRQRADQHARMQHFYQALQRHLGTQLGFTMPEGGRVVWVQLKQPVPTDRLLAALAGSALLAVPGEQFSVQGRYQHCLALTWAGEHSEGLVEPLYLLAQALELRCGVQLP